MFTESLKSDNVEEITSVEYDDALNNNPDFIDEIEMRKIYELMSGLSETIIMSNFVRMDSNSFGFETNYYEDGMRLFVHDYWLYIQLEHSGYEDEYETMHFVDEYHRIDISEGYDNIEEYVVMVGKINS
jgi:hypothetical protein